MTKNRIIATVLAVLVLCSALAFSGCGTVINSISDLFGNGNQSGQSGEEEIETIPEAGSWHAAVKLSSIKSVPFWQRAGKSIPFVPALCAPGTAIFVIFASSFR
ncbi:MAG: hypothetical protein IKS28_06505 [Clostridia bacterium]|nr:hypothetical protein [Clostridia bacterium]